MTQLAKPLLHEQEDFSSIPRTGQEVGMVAHTCPLSSGEIGGKDGQMCRSQRTSSYICSFLPPCWWILQANTSPYSWW